MDSGEDIIKANMAALEAAEESGEDVVLPYPDADSALKEPEKAQEEDTVEVDTLEAEEVDEKDEIAKKDGYISKEDWIASGKPEEDYMSKEDFAEVGELRDGELTRQQLAKELVLMKASLKDVANNQRKLIDDAKEEARQAVIADLQEKKKEAIEFQDAEGAAEIERKIVAAENDKPAVVEDETPKALSEWYSKNDTWYNVDAVATGALNAQLKKHETAGLPFEEGMAKAMEVVKKNFPYHFDDVETVETKKDMPTRVTARAVETSQKKVSQTKGKTFADLPEDERRIAKQGAKMSGLTEAEYMENY